MRQRGAPPVFYFIGAVLSCAILYVWFAHKSPIDSRDLVSREPETGAERLERADPLSLPWDRPGADASDAMRRMGGPIRRQVSVEEAALVGKYLLKDGEEPPADPAGRVYLRKEQLPRARIWHPGSVGTMDHRPDRLNIHVDEHGQITRVNYG